MDLKLKITDYSLRHYKLVAAVMLIVTLALGALIPKIKVDTDPENMLSEDEAVRLFHNDVKKRFTMYDMVVLGIVNEKDPNGVFNPSSLQKIYELTEFAKGLRWPSKEEPNIQVGVVDVDLLAPSTVDHIGQGAPGVVRFEWLMRTSPQTDAEALQVRDRAMANPLLKGTVVSEDGRALCLYLPLTSKDLSHKVYTLLRKKITGYEGDEQYYITGLPVAEDTFGYEMFIQMAVSAPLAMLVIFILMLVFFRKLVLIISPMIVALVSVISTMGLLIGLGYPVHIMSSMIPIFLMPIAVVDSVHILSEFFDLYRPDRGRKDTIRRVMDNLFTPMLYTSLTSAAGFVSLSLTPIPPVQVFGIFVATGIMIAWVCTVTFVPAYIMMLREDSLQNFGAASIHEEKQTLLVRILHGAGRLTYKAAKPILVAIAVVLVVAIYGVTKIRINDNPIRWFARAHPIRVADEVLNEHFGGTYMAYLVLEDAQNPNVETDFVDAVRRRLLQKRADIAQAYPNAPDIVAETEKVLLDTASTQETKEHFLNKLVDFVNQKIDKADEKTVDAWYEVSDFLDMEIERLNLFKQPEMLRYISGLQDHLAQTELVGKSSSVADIVKKVHQELIDGRSENYIIPDSSWAVAQCLIQFQSSHRPQDLWHFVTADYRHANIWLQLRSGDNRDMQNVVEIVDRYFRDNPAPASITHNWAGLTYINVVWQEKMVRGMLQSLMGSFIIVFIMMAVLFRSPLWGLVCMIPLSVTIAVIYGLVGLVGKDYDMPVAVLSALTLGMAVDFAIHFLERARASYAKTASWKKSADAMFGEPARAISRNVLVIAIGFLPLLAAPLIPYKTVGIFVCAIMALSGAVTLLVLPAILNVAEKLLFRPARTPVSVACNCGFCMIIAFAVATLIALNMHQYWKLGWNRLAVISIIVVPVLALLCGVMSRRQACKAYTQSKEKQEQKNDTKSA